jgi:hypothetical protein
MRRHDTTCPLGADPCLYEWPVDLVVALLGSPTPAGRTFASRIEPPKPTFWPMPLQPVQQYFGGVQHKRAEEAPGNDAPVRTRYGGLILLDRKEDPGEGIGLRTGVAPVVDSRVRRNSEKSLYRRNQRSNS